MEFCGVIVHDTCGVLTGKPGCLTCASLSSYSCSPLSLRQIIAVCHTCVLYHAFIFIALFHASYGLICALSSSVTHTCYCPTSHKCIIILSHMGFIVLSGMGFKTHATRVTLCHASSLWSSVTHELYFPSWHMRILIVFCHTGIILNCHTRGLLSMSRKCSSAMLVHYGSLWRMHFTVLRHTCKSHFCVTHGIYWSPGARSLPYRKIGCNMSHAHSCLNKGVIQQSSDLPREWFCDRLRN